VEFYVNPKTGLLVMADEFGNFITGFKLNEAQLSNVLHRGRL
jgi:hypothetical protein